MLEKGLPVLWVVTVHMPLARGRRRTALLTVLKDKLEFYRAHMPKEPFPSKRAALPP